MGVSYANAFAAAAAHQLRQPTAAIDLATAACNELYTARAQVADPDRRADHHFSSRDVVSTTLRVCAEIATPASNALAADVIIDDFPIGLRDAIQNSVLPDAAISVLQRISRVRDRNSGTIDLNSERPLLRQLAVALATLSPTATTHRISMAQWRAAHPNDGLLAIGAPTAQAQLPIAWSLPGQETAVAMPTIAKQHIEAIDALGSVTTTEANREMLWNPAQLDWQSSLASLFVPREIADWLSQSTTAPHLIVAAAPVLSHVPLEALLIDKTPLGVQAAIRRLPVPTTRQISAQTNSTTAYFDPTLSWTPERSALAPDDITDSATELREHLGPQRLIIIGCHGQAATGLAGALTASDTTVVATAADLLAKPLHGSVLLLEACWSSRYVGSRTGEQFTLATAALLAGAHSVVAGSFALPADDQCTGRIAANFITALRDGADTAEALRSARADYWSDPPSQLHLPGANTATQGRTMPGTAPWAWAGLSTHG